MQKSLTREVGIIIFKAVTVVVTIVLVIVSINYFYEIESSVGDGFCNVAVLPIEGTILPFYGLVDAPLVVTPEMVETFMDTVEEQGDIDAVLIEINSPGGTPVASQRIAQRLRNSPLPSVGLIGDIGASGGYMVAIATDYLIASPMSTVGSIGVTMSYVENSKQNDEDGLTYVELNTGKFKNSGDPNKPLTDEERAVFQRDLDILHTEFVNMVALYRNKPVEEVRTLADGSTMTGGRALENGLIDAVGGRAEARTAFAKILNTNEADVRFCEYESSLIPFY
ncbi:MAG: signal peptide peptidase SppA [Candidatus Pacebacteria bacterium]|nr:signal peptide peptidase SppA [Candidatus Paceibacterota bacterium]